MSLHQAVLVAALLRPTADSGHRLPVGPGHRGLQAALAVVGLLTVLLHVPLQAAALLVQQAGALRALVQLLADLPHALADVGELLLDARELPPLGDHLVGRLGLGVRARVPMGGGAPLATESQSMPHGRHEAWPLEVSNPEFGQEHSHVPARKHEACPTGVEILVRLKKRGLGRPPPAHGAQIAFAGGTFLNEVNNTRPPQRFAHGASCKSGSMSSL